MRRATPLGRRPTPAPMRLATASSNLKPGRAFSRQAPRMGAATVTGTHYAPPPSVSKLFKPGTSVRGNSGREYVIESVLQDREDRHVYLARTADHCKYVLKSLFDSEYDYALPLQLRFTHNPYLRALKDTIPNQKMFVTEYLTGDLLDFTFHHDQSLAVHKRILRDALRGLAALHEQNIVHLDVKANNIMLDYRDAPWGGISIERVQLSDLEDSTHIPPGQALRGMQVGNHFWRSPEAHVKGAVGAPSDIFSLATVFVFVRLRRVIYWVDASQTPDPTEEILERQISYFANWDDFEAFLRYLGPRHEALPRLRRIADGFGESPKKPRRPFTMWRSDLLDEDFKDLVARMTRFDPEARISAREALEHPWFRGMASNP